MAEHGFAGGYDAVKRFVRAWRAATPLPFRRMETAPGEEVQIDYGQGAWVIKSDGTRFRHHLLRQVLSASRKGYTEMFRRQTKESFIRGVENGFRAFGGVPATAVLDYVPGNIIDPDPSRHSAEELKASYMPLPEGLGALRFERHHEHRVAVGERHHEEGHLSQVASQNA